MSPGKISKDFKRFIGRGPNELLAKTKFEEGQTLFDQGKYAEAAKCFKIAANRWPDSTLKEDARCFGWPKAISSTTVTPKRVAYSMLIKKYENTRDMTQISPRHFAIARYWDLKARVDSHWYPNLTDKTRPMLATTEYAIRAYSSVKAHDPNGPLADDATMCIANSYFLRNRFEDAATYYEEVRKRPDSQHILPAHLLGIRSKLRSYLGPQYELSPLTDAEQLIDTTLAISRGNPRQ